MKRLVKTLSLMAILLVSSFTLMACDLNSVDPTKLVGTWVNNTEAEITQIQFIERSNENGVLSGDVVYYINGDKDKEPQTTDFWQTTDTDGSVCYNIDMAEYEGYTNATWKVKLENGKLVITSNSSVSWEYTKKYDK